MDPPLYIKHNRFHLESSKEFIRNAAASEDWRDLEVVMDIGCGPGNTSTHWIDHYFPSVDRLIGIDIEPGMIELANQENKKDNIQYYVADIMKRDDLQQWAGSVSAVISTFVFHRVTDQSRAFRNVFDLLRPSGKAAILFILRSPFYQALMDLLHTPKWKPILEPTNIIFPESYNKGYDVRDYRRMFTETGFEVSLCEMKPVVFTYDTDEECKNLLMSLHAIGGVSDEVRAEYKEAMFERFVHHSPRDPQGRPTHNSTVLHVRLGKGGKGPSTRDLDCS